MKNKMIEENNQHSELLTKVLNKLMALRNVSMNQLHKLTGVPLTTINRMATSKNINPTIATLIPIANYFGVTLNQLMGIDPLNTGLATNQNCEKTAILINVPLITWEQAISWSTDHAKIKTEKTISTDARLRANSFALIITEPTLEGFFPTSVLIVDSEANPEHSDYAIVYKIGQKRATLKQILIDDDKIYLRPLNKEYQTQMMSKSYIILGTVAQVRSNR
jgi:SOS-response transcriptional repressor LexA